MEDLLKVILAREPPYEDIPGQRFYAVCAVRWGNILRRRGDLCNAQTIFEKAVSLLAPLGGDTLNEQSTTEYEIGYINFLRGDFDNAIDYFNRSFTHARDAGNLVNACISRCLEWNVRFHSDLKSGKEFSHVLEESYVIFDAESRVRPDALRWVTNIKRHHFDIAMLTGDVTQAKFWFEELERDIWIHSFTNKRELVLYGRFALIEGRFIEATEYFEKYLNREPERGAHTEQAARVYWELGRAFDGQGNRKNAIDVWEEGLTVCEDDCGNKSWKERIKAELNAKLSKS